MTLRTFSKIEISREASWRTVRSDDEELHIDDPEITEFRVQIDDKAFLKQLATKLGNSGAEANLLSVDSGTFIVRSVSSQSCHAYTETGDPTLVPGTWKDKSIWCSKNSLTKSICSPMGVKSPEKSSSSERDESSTADLSFPHKRISPYDGKCIAVYIFYI